MPAESPLTFDEALDANLRLRNGLADLWRTGYGNRPEQLRLTADQIERDAAALVAYLRRQASEGETQ